MSLFGKKKETVSVIYISYAGDSTTVAVPVGDSVMEGAIANNVEGIVAECGGACQCATCHVYVDDAFADLLKPADEGELEMLTNAFAERRANSRLGCQIRLTRELDGLMVRTPEAQQ